MPNKPHSEQYLLKTGEEAAARLRLLQTVAGPPTAAFLKDAGLGPGMVVADIGCGIGTVTAHIAREVAPGGQVTGVDGSEAQLAVARRHLDSEGLSDVRTVAASAYDTGLPHGAFNLVYCRLLLCHLQRPLQALREMRSLLKPGGVLVCEDRDTDAMFSEPSQEVYVREVQRVRQTATARGLDPEVARKLPGMLLRLGFTDIEVNVYQVVRMRGEAKRVWEFTVAEAAPFLIEQGFMTETEARQIVQEMARVNLNPAIVVGLPRIWQVRGKLS